MGGSGMVVKGALRGGCYVKIKGAHVIGFE